MGYLVLFMIALTQQGFVYALSQLTSDYNTDAFLTLNVNRLCLFVKRLPSRLSTILSVCLPTYLLSTGLVDDISTNSHCHEVARGRTHNIWRFFSLRRRLPAACPLHNSLFCPSSHLHEHVLFYFRRTHEV